MPTVIGHAVLGAAAGWALPRSVIPVSALLLGILCSAVPDLDSAGLWLGVPYGHSLGHRGLSHGLAFAVFLAAAVTAVVRSFPGYQGSHWALFAYLALCTASHGVLDAMTNGGLGVAFFSPFSNERFFFPWRPLVVSPIHPARILSPWGVRVFTSEALCIGVPVALVLLCRFLLTSVRAGSGERRA